ncbi:hypothetical protein Srufu_037320 [Streptomyces libani subsp. rufus]|nr:hypothetical protein Srufu_037320 [Streptomyces libani subsp. rufus]
MKARTPKPRSTASRSSSSNRYVIGHARPTSGPAASKYAQTFAITRSGMKCVCTSISPGSPNSRQNAPTRSSPSATPGPSLTGDPLRPRPYGLIYGPDRHGTAPWPRGPLSHQPASTAHIYLHAHPSAHLPARSI